MSVQWSEAEIRAIEETLDSNGYAVLVDYIQAHAARATTVLTQSNTDWDQTNRLRGKLAGIGLLLPDEIRKQYPKSDNP